MIVGCRSQTAAAEQLTRDAQVIVDLDSDEYYASADLVNYVVDIAGPRATEVAEIVEQAAGRSFEAARAEAMDLLAREALPDPSGYRPTWTGVAGGARRRARRRSQ